MHLGQGDDERELVVLHVELEQGPSPHNLQAWKHDLPHVNMRDQHVAGHFPGTSTDEISENEKLPKTLPDVLKEAEIEVLVLEPGELEVAVDVGAVGVAVAQVAVVVLAVVGHRHAAVGADAYCKERERDRHD